MDVADLDTVYILVTGITCLNDTTNIGFMLRYDDLSHSFPDITAPSFSIFPNPENGVIYLSPEKSAPYTLVNISISDLTGRMMEIVTPVADPLTGITEVRFRCCPARSLPGEDVFAS